MSRRKFTREFKKAAVRKLELGTPIQTVAKACRVQPQVLTRWKQELKTFGTSAFRGYGKSRAPKASGVEPRYQMVVFRLSDDEMSRVREASITAGSRSLSDFARSLVLKGTGDGPAPLDLERKLELLTVEVREIDHPC